MGERVGLTTSDTAPLKGRLPAESRLVRSLDWNSDGLYTH